MADPFRKLEPPSGGLAGLRTRLDRRTSRRRVLVPALGLGAACAAALLAVLARPMPPAVTAVAWPDDPSLVSLGLMAGPGETVVVPADRADELAVLRRQSGVPGVTYYRISLTERRAAAPPWSPAAPAEPVP